MEVERISYKGNNSVAEKRKENEMMSEEKTGGGESTHRDLVVIIKGSHVQKLKIFEIIIYEKVHIN